MRRCAVLLFASCFSALPLWGLVIRFFGFDGWAAMRDLRVFEH